MESGNVESILLLNCLSVGVLSSKESNLFGRWVFGYLISSRKGEGFWN